MTEHILSCSYGKDSLACIGACMELGWEIDRIVHAEVWATDDIPADLPPMVEFKKKADKIIKDRYGIVVEHICAMRKPKEEEVFQTAPSMRGGYKRTYESVFYREVTTERARARAREYKPELKCHQDGKAVIYGFPLVVGAWCNSRLKTSVLNAIKKGDISRYILPQVSERNEKEQDIWFSTNQGELVHRGTQNCSYGKFPKGKESEVVQYLGIASDEPMRIERHINKNGILLPLVEIGWTEADAKKWCIDNDLLSPIYTDKCLRGGCWFCHNQGVDQLRQLRKNYPELWELLMKWDSDSPTTFHADGKTVYDFERRFRAEDEGFISAEDRFYWKDLEMQQYNIFHYFNENGDYKGNE